MGGDLGGVNSGVVVFWLVGVVVAGRGREKIFMGCLVCE